MKFYRDKAISPEDGVVFLDWRTEAPSSQRALRGFSQMLDDCLSIPLGLEKVPGLILCSDFEIKGDFNVEIREVEREEIPRPRAA